MKNFRLQNAPNNFIEGTSPIQLLERHMSLCTHKLVYSYGFSDAEILTGGNTSAVTFTYHRYKSQTNTVSDTCM